MSFRLFAQSGHSSLVRHARGAAPGYGQGLLSWYETFVLGAALAALYSNVPVYGYLLKPALLPKYTYFGIFVLMVPILVIKYRDLRAYLISPFVLWAGLFLALNLIHLTGFAAGADISGIYLVDDQLEARRSLIMTRAQYVAFAIFFGFIVYASSNRRYLYALVFLMGFLPSMVLLDFIRPGLFYPIETDGAVLGRAAAMFINPTMAGEAILLVYLLGCAAIRIAYRGPLLLLAGAAILTTFSRASILAWILIFLILTCRKMLPRSAIITAAIVFGISVLFLGSFQTYLNSRQEFDAAAGNLVSRLDFFSSFTFNDDSSQERAGVIRAGWELFLQDPIFGAGAGATLFWSHRASTHNQLLLLAAEYGIFGVGLWLWLLVILWKGKFFEDKGLQFAMAFLFAFMSLFTHQMMDAATYWLATFALISVRKNNGGLARSKSIAPKYKSLLAGLK